MNLKEIKKDIIEYNLYWVVDDIPYGDYRLTIINESDKIIIALYNDWGSVAYMMDKEDFLSISTTEDLKKHINSILYYNYIEYEGE